MWQQQPNEAAQIVSTVIKLTGSLDNRRSLLCRSFAEEGFCSIGLHVAGWATVKFTCAFQKWHVLAMAAPCAAHDQGLTTPRCFAVAEMTYDVCDVKPRLTDRFSVHEP